MKGILPTHQPKVQSRFIVMLLAAFILAMTYASSLQAMKNTFISNDPFQTAVFLKNENIVAAINGDSVLYYTSHNHINAYFTESGVFYRLTSVALPQKSNKKNDENNNEAGKHNNGTPLNYSILKMTWTGANQHPVIEAESANDGYYTYIQNTGSGYATLKTEGYRKITYRDIYPGIDAVYTFPDKGGMKYNLVVHPGANAALIQMAYSGAIEKMYKNSAGDVIIKTQSGTLIEHAPVSYVAGNSKVNSAYYLDNHSVKFHFKDNYDKLKLLIIDPWITAITIMPAENLGLKTDYDFLGNLYVYGAGPENINDTSNYFRVAKYSPAGNFLWVFNGQVPLVGWSTSTPNGLGNTYDYPGGFSVDKVSAKSYVSQGIGGFGTQTIRLTSTGAYDNFLSSVIDTFREAWGVLYNCSDASIIEVGGGNNSFINLGIINTTSGAVSASNITGLSTFYGQDIVCAAYDSAGNMYAIINGGGIPFTNTLYKINSTFDGHLWDTTSTFTTFSEINNMPYWGSGFYTGNWNNCLAANGNYLFYYDGYNIAAYNFTNGGMVGTPVTIPGYTSKTQGGIAVDNCNNLYLGGIGVIKTFNFNGSVFTQGADISLGGAFANDSLHDIVLNKTTNQLYIAGSGVTGICAAQPIISCNTTLPFKFSLANYCDTMVVHVSPDSDLSPLAFTYLLFDSAYNVLSQQTNVNDTITGFGGLHNTTYYVQVQWNANCGGAILNDTLVINCISDSISPVASFCAGTMHTISARGDLGGGTYLWQPGGLTDSVIVVSPVTNTTYTCTYQPPVGTPWVDSVVITVIPLAALTVNDTAICVGDTVILLASVSVPGGHFQWLPTGDTTSVISVVPAVSSNYTVTYTSTCNAPADTAVVTVQQEPVLTIVSDTICQAGLGQLSVSAAPAGGTYLWLAGGQTTQSITVSSGISGNYIYAVNYSLALCSVKDSAILTVDSLPILATVNDTICQGTQATLSVAASIAGGNYLWTPGNFTTSAIQTNPGSTQTYSVGYQAGACLAVDSAQAVVDPMPALTTTGDTICTGNAGQVTVTPTVTGGTYLWNPGNESTPVVTDSPAVTTVYTVVYTAGLCSVSGSATITVTPQPLVSVIGDTACTGNAVQLTATPTIPGGTYNWAPNGNTSATLSLVATTSNTYTVTYTIAGCGTAVDSAMVKVLPQPTLTTADTAFCQGSSGHISATPSIAGGVYTWAPGVSTDSTFIVSPITTSTYIVVYNLNGCVATDSAVATVYINPAANITGYNASCGKPNGTAATAATGGTPPYVYLWSNGGNTDSISQLPGNIIYAVSVSDVNGCSVSDSVFINQSSAVSAVAFGINEKCPAYTDASAWVTDTGGIMPYTYNWSNGETDSNISDLLPGSYNVTVHDVAGCSASALVAITAAPNDTFSLSAQATSCYGIEYKDGSIRVTDLSNIREPYQYSLNGGAYQLSDTFTNLAAGNYTINIQDDSGCITATNSIDVTEAPEANLAITPADTTVNVNQTVQLIAVLNPYAETAIDSFLWSPSYGLSCNTCQSPVVNSETSKNVYTLSITYNGHCTASATATVNIQHVLQFFIPDAFSPNGDGKNDVLYVYGNDILSLNLEIFNRWGELMFKSADQNIGWDGTYKGVIQPEGTYLYEVAIYSMDHAAVLRKGSITLLR